MVLPLPDLLTLATLAKRVAPARVFEIGTFTGESTLLMAMNTPPATSIFTLDLPPPDPTARKKHKPPSYIAGSAYAGSPHTSKITQLYGDSRTFDFGPWAGTIDLVLVDANHTYPFVKADSTTALRLLRPGGVIVWDDYVWVPEYPECAGVAQYLHELQRSIPCFRVAGTRFAVHIGGAPIDSGSR
jgi:predicted O-methyltransferase YrrM